MARDPEEQARDDEFRDRMLGNECFCGIQFGSPRRVKLAQDIEIVSTAKPCNPLKCLAHGYCEAHLTPVAAQMTDADKARIAMRCGFDLNKVFA